MPGHRNGTKKEDLAAPTEEQENKKEDLVFLKKLNAAASKLKTAAEATLPKTVTNAAIAAHEKTMGHINAAHNAITNNKHFKKALEVGNAHAQKAVEHLETAKSLAGNLHNQLKESEIGQKVTGQMQDTHAAMKGAMGKAHMAASNVAGMAAARTASLSTTLKDHSEALQKKAQLMMASKSGGRKSVDTRSAMLPKSVDTKRHATKKRGHKKRHATKKRGHKKRKQREASVDAKCYK